MRVALPSSSQVMPAIQALFVAFSATDPPHGHALTFGVFWLVASQAPRAIRISPAMAPTVSLLEAAVVLPVI